MRDVVGGLAILLAAVLLVAGVSKLFSATTFAHSLRVVTGDRLRSGAAMAVARGAGLFEVTAAMLVAVPATARLGAALGGLIGLAIVGWVVVAALRRVTVSCGCFGGNAATPLGARNAIAGSALVAGFAAVLLLGSPRWGLHLDDRLSLLALASLTLVVGIRLPDFYPLLKNGLRIGR